MFHVKHSRMLIVGLPRGKSRSKTTFTYSLASLASESLKNLPQRLLGAHRPPTAAIARGKPPSAPFAPPGSPEDTSGVLRRMVGGANFHELSILRFGNHPLLRVGASSCPDESHLPPTNLPILNGADLLILVPAFSIGPEGVVNDRSMTASSWTRGGCRQFVSGHCVQHADRPRRRDSCSNEYSTL